MRIKAFQNFSIGKLIEKNKKDKPGAEDAPIPEITEIKDNINGQAEDVENATEKLDELSGKAGIIVEADDIPVRPHGPTAELSVEPEDLNNDVGLTLDEVDGEESTTLGEEVNISEVSAEKTTALKEAPVAADPAPAEEKNEAKPDEGDSLNNLFSTEEDEENPLASLINSLPDVTVQELMDDLEEIQRIINEWRPSTK
jgi:hypothetical protein